MTPGGIVCVRSDGRRGRAGQSCSGDDRGERPEHESRNSTSFQGVLSDGVRTVALTWRPEPGSSNPVRTPRVRALADALALDEVTASVLVRRGYDEPAEARRFLDGALPGHDPFALGDMREAVDAITAAVDGRASGSACTATTTPTGSAPPRSPSSCCAS